MKNYIDELCPVSVFKQENPALSEQAEKAMQYLKGYCPNIEEDKYVVIVVEGYHCIACVLDDFSPYTLASEIAPFDENRIYPLQGLVTIFAFKKY